jgi:protein-S-isoprenylcysteine O-methyltransferase Ste14
VSRACGMDGEARRSGRAPTATPSTPSGVRSTVKRFLVFLYGVVCYGGFLVVLLYLIGFLGNVVVPRGIDGGAVQGPAAAIAIDVGLVLLFAASHTLMARPWFKAWWRRALPAPIERSTFVLCANLTLLTLFWQWRALPGTLWRVDTPALVYAIYGLQVAGWGLVLLSSFLINHFELFGLQQVYLHWRNRQPARPKFRLPWLYRLVRHPLMLGFLVAFWSTPHMTHGHLLFAAAMTAYVFVGIHFEERDLVRAFGKPYVEYQQATSMLLPVRRRSAGRSA